MKTFMLILILAAFFQTCSNSNTISPTPPEPTPSPSEDISNAIQAIVVDPYNVKLTNTLKYTGLKIFRKLADESEEVITLGPQGTYIDTVKWDGTQYYYWGEASGMKSNEVGLITDLAEITRQRGLFYEWIDVARSQNISDRVINIDPSSTVYDYLIHGVNVKMVFEKPVADVFSKEQLKGYFLKAVQMFHRHWQFYKGFPLKEIRVVNWDEDFTEYEGVLGSQFLKDFLLQTIDDTIRGAGEAQSHGMGHAWIDRAINFPNGWMWEGFDNYNGIVTLDHRLNFFVNNLKNPYFIEHKCEPLDSIYDKYVGTDAAGVYYIKGNLFAYLVSKRLMEKSGLDWSGFLKYLYDTHYLPYNQAGQVFPQDGRLIDLQMALNEFSGLDFTDMFDDYVYGTKDITEGLIIEAKYLPVFSSPSGKTLIPD